MLGETQGEIHETYEDILSGWGNIKKTEAGNVLSHICKVLEIAIEGQARALPIWSSGVYRGTVVHGAGWSCSYNGTTIGPVSFAILQDGLKVGDPHESAVRALIAATGGDEAAKSNMFTQATNMNRLRAILRDAWTRDRTISEAVEKFAPRLNYGERSWVINADTLIKACSLIQATSSLGMLDVVSDLPLHHSMLLSDDIVAIIWSCFGGMAPSFKIPYGRPMKLDGNMKIEVSAKGDTKKLVDVGKVAVRNVILQQAVSDIQWVISEKMILNPFGQGTTRASQQHQDRFFTGNEAKQLIAGLRGLCGVTALTGDKGKRKGDEADAGPSKRPRMDFGF
jgi:hypothetical protein